MAAQLLSRAIEVSVRYACADAIFAIGARASRIGDPTVASTGPRIRDLPSSKGTPRIPTARWWATTAWGAKAPVTPNPNRAAPGNTRRGVYVGDLSPPY